MKKIILLVAINCVVCSTYAQPCGEVDGLRPIPFLYTFNGNPGTTIPVIPGNWNRLYKLNETTGLLNAETCIFACCPTYGLCVCYVQGTYFRRVTPPCDPTPCGADLPLPGMPITNSNNSSANWSQSSTWIASQVPVIASSPAVVISKSIQIDADLNFTNDHWLILTSGNSTILAGNTVTNNATIKIYTIAGLENFGTINGNGQVLGSFVNSGTIAPGNSPGKFTITGNYTATNTAVHNIEIAAADLFDTLSIEQDVSFASGTAVINGTLNVSLLNGYIPALGDSYKIITYMAASGNFSAANLPTLPPGMMWSITYNATNITLHVVSGVLPLHFTNTKAWLKNNEVQVEWTAENEINVKEYAIEKSVDATHFNKIKTLNANENGNKNYAWLDAAPFTGNNYYRIKAIDEDEKFMYSTIMLVKIAADKKIIIYPNPAKRGGSLQISLQNITANKIEIINTAGQVVYSNSSKLTGSISVLMQAAWPAGQYVLRVISDREVKFQKIQLQ